MLEILEFTFASLFHFFGICFIIILIISFCFAGIQSVARILVKAKKIEVQNTSNLNITENGIEKTPG